MILVLLFLGISSSSHLDNPETLLAGVSRPDINGAMFAGGASTENGDGPFSNIVDLYGDSVPANQTLYCKLATPRGALAGAVLYNYNIAVFGGGRIDGNYSAAVDILMDTPDVCQQTTAQLSEARGYLTAAVTRTSVYFAGGWNNQGARSSIIDRYDASKKQWSVLDMKLPRSGHSSVGFDSHILIAGGEMEDGTTSSLVTVLKEDPTTGVATFAEPLTLSAGNRTKMAGTTISSAGIALVLFAGGEGPSCGCEIGWMCTPDFSFCASTLVDIINMTDPNQPVMSYEFMPSFDARSRLAAASYDSLAFFAGGKNLTGWSDTVDIYDSKTDSWSVEHLSVPRADLAIASSLPSDPTIPKGMSTSSPKIYFAGGVNDDGPSEIIDIYDISTGMWTSTKS